MILLMADMIILAIAYEKFY